MSIPALSLWEAYQVETLRSKGLDDASLLSALKEKNLETLSDVDNSFDYQELIDAADGKIDVFRQAIQSGYTVKFLTIYGVKNLLKLKYNLEAGIDYQMSENRFDGIVLDKAYLTDLKILVSSQWHVFELTDEHGNYSVSIQPDILVSKT